MSVSNYQGNLIIEDTLRTGTVYLALYTTNPTDTDTGMEVSGGSYARQIITFSVPSNKTTSNNNNITFPTATAGWGDILYYGIKDSLTSGNLIYYGTINLVPTNTILTDYSLVISIGQIQININ
jgi:hypothetical protein